MPPKKPTRLRLVLGLAACRCALRRGSPRRETPPRTDEATPRSRSCGLPPSHCGEALPRRQPEKCDEAAPRSRSCGLPPRTAARLASPAGSQETDEAAPRSRSCGLPPRTAARLASPAAIQRTREAMPPSTPPFDLIDIYFQRLYVQPTPIPDPRTGPLPIVRVFDQAGAHWVHMGVVDSLKQHLFIPEQSRIRVMLPEGLLVSAGPLLNPKLCQ
jgi:hypothetical protein